MANISFYGSHNSAIVVEEDGEIKCVVEVERFVGVKNCGYSQYLLAKSRHFLIKEILGWIKEQYGISEFDFCYYSNTDSIEGEFLVRYNFEKMIPAKKFVQVSHHLSHAAGSFYQTDYETALIVSFDGGGSDGFFNIYFAENRNSISEIGRLNVDLGFAYMSFGEFLSDIKKEHSLSIGNLVYSGKIMGLCSYGNVIQEWIEPIKEYYRQKPDGIKYKGLLNELSKKINVLFDENERLSGQLSWDLAKTSQIVFEELFIELVSPYLTEYRNIPLILTGGCALNILLNTRLKETLDREIFVPPNPNDCGIAVGQLLYHTKPKTSVDVTYSGIPVLDKQTLPSILENVDNFEEVNLHSLARYIGSGKIVGVVRGNSEHGSRALGNRSIICDPTKQNMKDILNQKVKHREWYRPFAPVVRLEDVSTYFEFFGESRWMSFCPKVKQEWKEVLQAITHVDGTARVQTVTRNQNKWLYDLLTVYKQTYGIGVLLNTSFNVDGKPILSTYKEALDVYNSTELDALVLQEYFIYKSSS